MTRRKFTIKFKTKVVLEALKERGTAKDRAQRIDNKGKVSLKFGKINNPKL